MIPPGQGRYWCEVETGGVAISGLQDDYIGKVPWARCELVSQTTNCILLKMRAVMPKCLHESLQTASNVIGGILYNFQMLLLSPTYFVTRKRPMRSSRARHDRLRMARAARYYLSGGQAPNVPASHPCHWTRNLGPHEKSFLAHIDMFTPPAFYPTAQHEKINGSREPLDGPSCKPSAPPEPGTC